MEYRRCSKTLTENKRKDTSRTLYYRPDKTDYTIGCAIKAREKEHCHRYKDEHTLSRFPFAKKKKKKKSELCIDILANFYR